MGSELDSNRHTNELTLRVHHANKSEMKMKYTKLLFVTVLFLVAQQPISYGQQSLQNADSLIHQFYKILSGPAGERNWELYKSLFHDKAILGAVRKDAQGGQSYSSFTPVEYTTRNADFFRTNG